MISELLIMSAGVVAYYVIQIQVIQVHRNGIVQQHCGCKREKKAGRVFLIGGEEQRENKAIKVAVKGQMYTQWAL